MDLKCFVLVFVFLIFRCTNISASDLYYYDGTETTLEYSDLGEAVPAFDTQKLISDFTIAHQHAYYFAIVTGDLNKDVKLNILKFFRQFLENSLSLRASSMDREAIQKIFLDHGKLGFIINQKDMLVNSTQKGDKEIVIASLRFDIEAARKIIKEELLIQMATLRKYSDIKKYLEFARDQLDNKEVEAYLKSIKLKSIKIDETPKPSRKRKAKSNWCTLQ